MADQTEITVLGESKTHLAGICHVLPDVQDFKLVRSAGWVQETTDVPRKGGGESVAGMRDLDRLFSPGWFSSPSADGTLRGGAL
jgi:hypothetical protein